MAVLDGWLREVAGRESPQRQARAMIHARTIRDRLLPCLLVWLAFCLRVYALDFQSLWRDEVDVLRFATRPAAEAVALLRQPGENGPLFYLLLRPWLDAAGQTEFALRFPSAWAGAAAVALLYVLVRRMVGPVPARLAALFAATAPFLTWYSQDAKMYALITALIVLILWLTTEAVRRGGLIRWAALYVLTSASLLIHLLAALALPVQMLWLLMLAGRQGTARRRATAAYIALLVVPYLILLGWTARLWLDRADPERYPFVPLFDMLALMAARFSQGALPGAPLALLPALLALVAGLLLGPQLRGRSGGRPVLLLAAWLVVPLIALYGISLRVPMFLDRYVIWTMPAFLALAGLGAAALLRAWRPLGYVVVGAVVALNLTGVWTQASRPIKSDFRGAAQFVAAHAQPGDRLIFQMPYNHYIFSYYYGALPDGWVDGPYTNGGLPAAGVDAHLAHGLGAAPAAWLIASEAPLWDRAGLTQAWLEGRGTVTAQRELARVTVTRYRLRAGGR